MSSEEHRQAITAVTMAIIEIQLLITTTRNKTEKLPSMMIGAMGPHSVTAHKAANKAMTGLDAAAGALLIAQEELDAYGRGIG